MSDAGDVEAPTVEVTAEVAPKGKLTVEDALQVCSFSNAHQSKFIADLCFNLLASVKECSRSRWASTRSPRMRQSPR